MHIFYHPEIKMAQLPIIPVFMPFAGCRVRCVFCSQTAQTGQKEQSVEAVLAGLERNLRHLQELGSGPVEVAFYGGTFTALPHREQLCCLSMVEAWRRNGLIQRVRCSTRPDCIDADAAILLNDNGVDLVELGVQSFSAHALAVSKRNYGPWAVHNACALLQKHGLEYGIQLMPGLPGASLEDSYADISFALELEPVCVRLYPCLVFEHTPLEHMWREGVYRPLSLDDTVTLLAAACLRFWERGVPVIRMGVAPEPSALSTLLAGPFHHSLGNMVRGVALHMHIKGIVAECYGGALHHDLSLSVPRRYQGDLWGFKGSLRDAYAELGISHVDFHDAPHFALAEI